MGQRPDVQHAGPPPLGYIARATLVVLGLWGLANVVWLGRDLFFIAFLAVLFAAFLSLLMRPLGYFKVPRIIAAPLMLLLWLALLTGLVALTFPLLEEQVNVLRQELPRGVAEVMNWFEGAAATFAGLLGEPQNGMNDGFQDRMTELASRLVTGALPILGSFLGGLTGLVVILFGGLYLAIESRLFFRGMLSLIPVPGRPRTARALRLAGHNLQRWIFGTLIAMVLVGGLTGTGLLLLGVPSALALAIIAGLLEFVPTFGPILAAVPAVAVALLVSPLTALWVVVLYVGVQQLESNMISPLVMKGAVKLPPALSLLFQLLMAILFGFVGLLVAVPLLAVILVFVKTLYVDRLETDAEPSGV